MNTLFNLIVVVQVLSALAIIGLVLMQHGKGADMGAAFGSGASGSLFGATGSSNFLSKSTALAAAVFFAATLGLALMANNRGASSGGGVLSNVTVPVKGSAAIPAATQPAPAAPAGSQGVPPATQAAPAQPAAPVAAPATEPAPK
ncbi:preprotein translocase subunit SecG [Pseudoduganella flava]|uniref:Protein-export membrane protein SecG n=1 Tax=Pseudoduganella flava TaxID=871742 RepID=A0A562PG00_9BURK|nr:preprotein translocase subunit SecG [Pseudoduganella flava]QGZ38851.1 preprotein translocase subunit SecG [Pseudoduganella flava]TWI42916.1 preprotein translocase subunit SecG [Pseudoduganella flava]